MGNATGLHKCIRHHRSSCKDDTNGRVSLRRSRSLPLVMALALGSVASQAVAQTPEPAAPAASPVQLVQPMEPGQTTPQITLTLQDALERARKYDTTTLA